MHVGHGLGTNNVGKGKEAVGAGAITMNNCSDKAVLMYVLYGDYKDRDPATKTLIEGNVVTVTNIKTGVGTTMTLKAWKQLKKIEPLDD
jgi:hypothetical protein